MDEKNKEYRSKYISTDKGITAVLYSAMRFRSKRIGRDVPNFSLEEFRNWFFEQKNSSILLRDWNDSGFKTSLKPSVDRIDASKGYFLENMQLMTVEENWRKGINEKVLFKNGGARPPRPVRKLIFKDKEWVKEEIYPSIKEAAKSMNISTTNIHDCLKGKQNTAGGFKWERVD